MISARSTRFGSTIVGKLEDEQKYKIIDLCALRGRPHEGLPSTLGKTRNVFGFNVIGTSGLESRRRNGTTFSVPQSWGREDTSVRRVRYHSQEIEEIHR